MEIVFHKRLDLTPLLTHRFKLDQIVDAYRLFAEHCDGVLNVAVERHTERVTGDLRITAGGDHGVPRSRTPCRLVVPDPSINALVLTRDWIGKLLRLSVAYTSVA
jgi:hypothetical protein